MESDQDTFLIQAGLERSKEMMRVEGRILVPPPLAYGNNVRICVSSGSWQLNGCPFIYPAKVNAFVVLSLDKSIRGDEIQ